MEVMSGTLRAVQALEPSDLEFYLTLLFARSKMVTLSKVFNLSMARFLTIHKCLSDTCQGPVSLQIAGGVAVSGTDTV